MTSRFVNAWGYQGDAMKLPVANVVEAIPFYEQVMGFRSKARLSDETPSATFSRDAITIRILENGGDPEQDGVAFEVENIASLLEEFQEAASTFRAGRVSPGLQDEKRDDGSLWKVFFVVAPDGLCYWFGERAS